MKEKNNNEITVRIKGDISEFYKIIKNKGFKNVDSFKLDDYFYIPKDLEIEKMTTRQILSKAVLIRKIMQDNKIMKRITFKKKEIDDNGNILNQENIDCSILDMEEAKMLLQAMGYKEIMAITENDLQFIKDDFQIFVKEVVNGDNLIEVELGFNENFDTLEQIIEKLKELELPIYTDNLFVKKAEIELNKILKRD